ncbi:unnamed protein product [Nippostrongylus brasiliensis]|uniref:Uncharacterized protein n=1 Tax=Nippostrongylus brasiliensis TaxID=27835 RepID=A0A0N4Y727_NIPBR|nr:unnamed protein product [Nippostrongylus brasiliensis]
MSITLLAIIHFTLLFHGTTLLILNLCTKQRGVVEGVRESDEDDLSRQSATGSKSKDVAKVKPTRKKASLDKKAPAEKKASSEKKASTEKKAPVVKKASSEKKASTENKPKPSPKPSPKSSQIKLLTKPQADKGVKKSIMGILKNLSPETRKPPKKEPSKEKASSEKKP